MDYLTPIATGGGGGILGAVAMWLQSRQSKREHEVTREGRLQELYDSIMGEVRLENDALKARITAFELRDARVYVIETCFRMVLPELIRKDQTNRTLAHVASLLRGLPVGPNDSEWTDMIARIDAADTLRKARSAANEVLNAARIEAAEVLNRAQHSEDGV
jgi:hypothetical protein